MRPQKYEKVELGDSPHTWNPPSFSVHSAGWSFRMRPDWPFDSMNEVQLSPLQVLMVELADWPAHTTGRRGGEQ